MADIPKRKFSLTSAAIAAVGAPIAYASLLAKNQAQGALQSINPANHLQNFTAQLAPAFGSFNRIYDKLNPRERLEDRMRSGGGGNIDLTPVVQQLTHVGERIAGLLTYQQQTVAPLLTAQSNNSAKLLTYMPKIEATMKAVSDGMPKLLDYSKTNSVGMTKLSGAIAEMVKLQKGALTSSERASSETDSMNDLEMKKGAGYKVVKKLSGEFVKKEIPSEDKKGGIMGWILGALGPLMKIFTGLGAVVAGAATAIGTFVAGLAAAVAGFMGLKALAGMLSGGGRNIGPSPGSSNNQARTPRQLRATVGRANEMAQRPMRSINSAGDTARGGRGILGRITGPMGVRGGQAATRAMSGATAAVQGSRGLLGVAGRAAGFVGKRLIPGMAAVSGAMGAVEAAKQGRWVEAGINAASAGVSFIPGIGGLASAGMQIGAHGAQDMADRLMAQPRPTTPRTEALATRAMAQTTPKPVTPPVTVINDNKTINTGGNTNGQGSDADSQPIGFVQRSLPEMAHSVFGYVPSVLV